MTDKTRGASGGKRPRRTFSPECKHEAARELNVGSQSLGK